MPTEPADEMAEANDAVQPAEAAASQNNAAAAAAAPRQIKMDLYAPPVFEGRSTGDAFSFLEYVERYAALKQMTDGEKLHFIAILLRDAASDFYEGLATTQLES